MNAIARPREVAAGTAEQLARLAFFRELEQTQPEELDAVAFWFLGLVPDRRVLWEQLRPDCLRLWHLITDDWDDRDLDVLDDRDWFPAMTVEESENARYERTRERLIGELESTVWLARYRAAEVQRYAQAAS